MTQDPQPLDQLATKALEYVPDHAVVGLGTGHAASAFIVALGERVRAGLRIQGVPTSQASADLATQAGIPLTTFDAVEMLDVAIDGADEVDPFGNMIKGYGGALVREKIVAYAARKLVILVGPEKVVPILGSRGKLPVEVLSFGLATCRRRLADMGLSAVPRMHDRELWLTDNGNFILDCHITTLARPAELEQALRAIPGVVGTGLFLGLAPVVLVGHGTVVEVQKHLV